MKKLLMGVSFFGLMVLNASASSCELEFTEFAKEIFVKDVCSSAKKYTYRKGVFSKAQEKTVEIFEKYCEFPPKVLCLDDIITDANNMVDAAKEDLVDKPALAEVLKFNKIFTPTQSYMNENLDLPRLTMTTIPAADGNRVVIRGVKINEKLNMDKLNTCNKKQGEFSYLTCLGEVDHSINGLYASVRNLAVQIDNEFNGYCYGEETAECKQGPFLSN